MNPNAPNREIDRGPSYCRESSQRYRHGSLGGRPTARRATPWEPLDVNLNLLEAQVVAERWLESQRRTRRYWR